jgi:hypothetical protein
MRTWAPAGNGINVPVKAIIPVSQNKYRIAFLPGPPFFAPWFEPWFEPWAVPGDVGVFCGSEQGIAGHGAGNKEPAATVTYTVPLVAVQLTLPEPSAVELDPVLRYTGPST